MVLQYGCQLYFSVPVCLQLECYIPHSEFICEGYVRAGGAWWLTCSTANQEVRS